ncbi:MAG: hypothetical protein PHH59_05640 [Methylovulum sp.]|uniref:hypothetical protein n=1 Tax=Methylovulum sp. TaxID=1916980 RepID=UPI002625209C|nr:hypothetical protein [Methylovulum sp.]MDD2723494.1 hypothetical protein [Methylovulum sp.]MDD5124536.1 hypothetical protein [Methylovulum sp.]
MNSAAEIKQLADVRLEEAEILCVAGKYDGAFYLAGYSVELMLKAKICENFGIDALFDESLQTPYGIRAVRDSVKKHDIRVLFIYSGLLAKFQKAKAYKQKLMTAYSYLIKASGKDTKEDTLWSEQVRYLPIGSKKQQEVQELIELLKDNEGLLKWIRDN